VITDGWSGYVGIEKVGYTRDRRSQRAATASGEDIDTLLPGVHRVASLTKPWLLSTHPAWIAPEPRDPGATRFDEGSRGSD